MELVSKEHFKPIVHLLILYLLKERVWSDNQNSITFVKDQENLQGLKKKLVSAV